MVVLYAVGEWTSASLVIVVDNTAFGRTDALSLIVQALGIVAVLGPTSTVCYVVSFACYRPGSCAGCLFVETGLIRRSRRLIGAEAVGDRKIVRSPLQRTFQNTWAMLRMRQSTPRLFDFAQWMPGPREPSSVRLGSSAHDRRNWSRGDRMAARPDVE